MLLVNAWRHATGGVPASTQADEPADPGNQDTTGCITGPVGERDAGRAAVPEADAGKGATTRLPSPMGGRQGVQLDVARSPGRGGEGGAPPSRDRLHRPGLAFAAKERDWALIIGQSFVDTRFGTARGYALAWVCLVCNMYLVHL